MGTWLFEPGHTAAMFRARQSGDTGRSWSRRADGFPPPSSVLIA